VRGQQQRRKNKREDYRRGENLRERVTAEENN
jgi:hypothetical protein